MRDRAGAVLAAVSFLTAIPVARRRRFAEVDLRRGVVAFPLVGGAVGGTIALAAWGAHLALPPLAAAAVGVAVGVAITAAFHLDGLGDVADGVGAALGGRSPAEAMRDPRLGTFGVAAVALDLLLKVSVLAGLLARGFPSAAIAAAAAARVAPVALAWRLPYAGGGTGGWTEGVGGATVAGAAVIATSIGLAALLPSRDPIGSFVALAAGGAAIASVAAALGRWSSRRLSGVTGDVFGAAAELGETLALAAVLAVS
jgi:adenosylcobinamide-GDP ribazoletransferase